MKDQKVSKQEKTVSGVSPVIAAVVGAAVGAGAAVVGVALSDKKKREKISKVVDAAKDSLHKTTKEVNEAVKSL